MQIRRFALAVSALAVLGLFGAGAALAQGADSDALIKYYRKKAQLSPSIPVSVGGVTDSPIAGAKQGTLFVGKAPRDKKVRFTSSADGRYVVFADAEDITIDPAKAVMDKISQTDVDWKGPADAPVTIVEYSDFQCPFCAKGYKIIEEEVLPAYEGKIRFAYKHLPLPFHNWAEPGAVAMECIRQQSPEGAWLVYEQMFKQQKAVNLQNVKAKAMEFAGAGVDKAKYDTCYDNKETVAAVRAQKAEAASLGITGTPSFVVNGRLVKGAQPAAKFKAIIDDELASAK
ncbi:MAG: thioredoxin domain-containing protein [Candidatus Binatia bacterium]|nr:thioredoxin domain-containing protein [Candidatus Binatia bacterium]